MAIQYMDALVIESTAESQGRPEVQEALQLRERVEQATHDAPALGDQVDQADHDDDDDLLNAPTLRLGDQLSQDRPHLNTPFCNL